MEPTASGVSGAGGEVLTPQTIAVSLLLDLFIPPLSQQSQQQQALPQVADSVLVRKRSRLASRGSRTSHTKSSAVSPGQLSSTQRFELTQFVSRQLLAVRGPRLDGRLGTSRASLRDLEAAFERSCPSLQTSRASARNKAAAAAAAAAESGTDENGDPSLASSSSSSSDDDSVFVVHVVQPMADLKTVDDVENLFSEFGRMVASDRQAFFQLTGLFGLHLRWLRLAHQRLSFSGVARLSSALQEFTAAYNHHATTAGFSAAAAAAAAASSSSLSSSAVTSSSDAPARARVTAEAFLQSWTDRDVTFAPEEIRVTLQRRISQLQHDLSSPDEKVAEEAVQFVRAAAVALPHFPETHLLRYGLALHERDFTTALDAHFRFFDFSPPARGLTGGSARTRFKWQYASLHLASLQFHFGHYDEAIDALSETMRVAQDHGDHKCVAHAMAWLFCCSAAGGRRNPASVAFIDQCLAQARSLGLLNLAAFASSARAALAADLPHTLVTNGEDSWTLDNPGSAAVALGFGVHGNAAGDASAGGSGGSSDSSRGGSGGGNGGSGGEGGSGGRRRGGGGRRHGAGRGGGSSFAGLSSLLSVPWQLLLQDHVEYAGIAHTVASYSTTGGISADQETGGTAAPGGPGAVDSETPLTLPVGGGNSFSSDGMAGNPVAAELEAASLTARTWENFGHRALSSVALREGLNAAAEDSDRQQLSASTAVGDHAPSGGAATTTLSQLPFLCEQALLCCSFHSKDGTTVAPHDGDGAETSAHSDFEEAFDLLYSVPSRFRRRSCWQRTFLVLCIQRLLRLGAPHAASLLVEKLQSFLGCSASSENGSSGASAARDDFSIYEATIRTQMALQQWDEATATLLRLQEEVESVDLPDLRTRVHLLWAEALSLSDPAHPFVRLPAILHALAVCDVKHSLDSLKSEAIVALAGLCLEIGLPDCSIGFLRNAACQAMENASAHTQGQLQLVLAKAYLAWAKLCAVPVSSRREKQDAADTDAAVLRQAAMWHQTMEALDVAAVCFRQSEELNGLREVAYLRACTHALRAGAASEGSEETATTNKPDVQQRDAYAAEFLKINAALSKPKYSREDALMGLEEAMDLAEHERNNNTPNDDEARAAFQSWAYTLQKATAP